MKTSHRGPHEYTSYFSSSIHGWMARKKQNDMPYKADAVITKGMGYKNDVGVTIGGFFGYSTGYSALGFHFDCFTNAK